MAKAQASVNKVINSPFGRVALNGGGADGGGARPNDSLDAMRLDFMADY